MPACRLIVRAAAIAASALMLSGCLALGVAGAAIGVAGAAAKGAGAVVGAAIPDRKDRDKDASGR